MTSYNYDSLPNLHELQDISEYLGEAWRINSSTEDLVLQHEPLTFPSSNHTAWEHEYTEHQDSTENRNTNTSSSLHNSGLQYKLKAAWVKGLKRVRGRPPSQYMQRSFTHEYPTADVQPTRISRGVWKDQLLIDRSLRSMALLMTIFAIIMIIIICVNAREFGKRKTRYSSSIGGATGDCKTITSTNTGLLFVVNVAATMVLGMSNTYQQLVTSLEVDDLKHGIFFNPHTWTPSHNEAVLCKYGDARVGTNSPWNISKKRGNRIKHWAAWLLLMCTSLPVHFLANSLIGPSYVLEPPSELTFTEVPFESISDYPDYETKEGSFEYQYLCWSAFRTGQAHFPPSKISKHAQEELDSRLEFGVNISKLNVTYAKENCSNFARTSQDLDNLEWPISENNNTCSIGTTVLCGTQGTSVYKCRLNIRMNAAFVLAFVLVAKAAYMVTVNLRGRGRIKTQLLTFGDIIVASASQSALRVHGECMVNANESYRSESSHKCHRHCKNAVESKTGDEVGHCQKCKSWNSTNKSTSQPQPTIATKIKHRFISNLGNTALAQMSILIVCSLALVSFSIWSMVGLVSSTKSLNYICGMGGQYIYSNLCRMGESDRLATLSGGWGGFNHSISIGYLTADNIESEYLSFLISNGAQFIYSLLYLLLIYNITLVSQEYDWGKLEFQRSQIRSTIAKGEGLNQGYLLQLPKKVLFPAMVYSVVTHWMLGEALQAQEVIWLEDRPGRYVQHSIYSVAWAAYPMWTATILMLVMTAGCWWAFTYRREGTIPQMFGSMRVLCAATTQLDDFPAEGIKWGDITGSDDTVFRHAGLSARKVADIVPNELYAGIFNGDETQQVDGKLDQTR